VRNQRLSKSWITAVAGGVAAVGFVIVTANPAMAHFTCADGSTTTVDDPAVACAGHGCPAGSSAPTTEAPGHDHDAAPTTAKPSATTRPATPTTRKPTTPPTAVTAKPAFTG
jgi:hypothetical protein